MTPEQTDLVYEELAIRLDAMHPDQRLLFFAKLTLLMAHDLNDPDHVLKRINEAAVHLDPS